MKIGINAQLCRSENSYRNAGISQYIRRLLTSLASLPTMTEIHVFVSGQAENALPERLILHESSPVTSNSIARITWEQLMLPHLARRLRLDVLHSPAYVLPIVCPCTAVVTVLDLAFMRYPETFPLSHRKYLSFFTRRAVNKADAVIVISESTRRDVIEIFNVPADKVVTTPLGVDERFKPASRASIDEVRKLYGFGDRSVLYLGTLEPRKNVPALLAAFAQVKKALEGDCQLVIAGGKGWGYERLGNLTERLGISNYVKFTGYVPAELLPALYSAASVFVYPSLYEGFGLPPLEAMACGTPVITSNTSSLPEVVGDAGLMVSPDDISSLADAIVRVLTDESLREQMRTKGLAQAMKFSWEETAQRTLKMYQDVYSKTRG